MEEKNMAFIDIEPEEEENGYDKYPSFEKVGDSVEGNLYEFDKDQWNNKRMVLEVGEDEDGEPLLAYLPSHAHLKRFYKKVKIGDFLHVELTKLIPPKEDQEYPTRIYKIQVDPERHVEYDDDEFYEE